MAKRKTRNSTRTTTRKASNNKWKSFFKYLLVVVISSAVAIVLFINRHDISEKLSDSRKTAKELLLNKDVKSKNKPATDGYDKDERASLDALISEEVE